MQAARKLRQASFDSVKDASGGLLSPGERLKGKHVYIIEEAIARSGFGATFRATRSSDDKQVLIKQMLDQSHYDQFKKQLLNSFKREAKFLRKIKHPAFPRGFDYFERNKSFYLVMEFINGKELAKAVEDYRQANHGKIEDGLIVHVGIEIAEALEILHAQGYIYRDLKPQNVMLDGITGRVKLIDFGTLHKPSDANPLLFESEGYTPPEFVQAPTKFTAAGDIFSLGALLFEMAKGETPKPGDKSLSKRDARLTAVIHKCLEKDAGARYQSARELKFELVRLTKKGLWPFKRADAITPVELSVLPKTLYPSTCTFCDYCGWADPKSQLGYCKKCRIPLKVGRLVLEDPKTKRALKEFFLYSDETLVGMANECHFSLAGIKGIDGVLPRHIKVIRRGTSLFVEAVEKTDPKTRLNRRRIVGPIELIDGDAVELHSLALKFSLKDAC